MKILIAVLLSLLPFSAHATGVTPYSLGASTGTTLVVLSAVPASFNGIEVSSAAAGDRFKCWDASSASALTISSAATLGSAFYQTTSGGKGPATIQVNAANGIVCGKTSATSEALIYFSAY